MVKRRRLQCIFSNLLSKWKVSSEGGKVGIKLFGHLVGTYQGGGADWIQISKELGLIHVFDRLSLLRGEENRTEI